MKVKRPLTVVVPASGVAFAESVHEIDFRMAERRDPFHKLIYVLRGTVMQTTSEEPRVPVTLHAGTVWIVPRGERHGLIDREPATLLLLCVDPAFVGRESGLDDSWRELTRLPGRRLELDRLARQRLEGAWRRALLEQSHPRLGSAPAVRALAVQILVQLARRPSLSAASTSSARVTSVIREIDDAFFEDWSLDRAASRAGLSRRRFSQLFREATGRTVHDHLQDLRLTRVARLLQSGEHSILGAMFMCGFGDTSHFYRVFKSRFGLPPRQWQAQAANPHPVSTPSSDHSEARRTRSELTRVSVKKPVFRRRTH